MEKLHFEASRAQRGELEGLAYWIADRAHGRERGELDMYEEERTGETLRAIFHGLDRLGVPLWVQNDVIGWAEDWRRYLSEDFAAAMRKKGVIL